MTDEHQPTMEQSLYSIALSMIEIHKELKTTRRIAKDTLRFAKGEARQNVTRFVPQKRGLFDWIKSLLPVW